MGAIFGQCPLCPAKSPAKRLYGGFCSYHLGNQKDDHSKHKVDEDDDLPKFKKQVLKKFFAEQVLLIPRKCENCGGFIVFTAAGKASHVCHILPKRTFESVMVHPLNRWFGCLNCHHDFDDKGWSHAVTMKVWPVCVDRFRQFMNLITDTELTKLPDPFRVIMAGG